LKRYILLLILLTPAGAAQAPPSVEEEKRLLQEAVSQAGDGPLEFIRVAERHLNRFPKTPLRRDLEKAILKASMDARDNQRIISYGEKILPQESDLNLVDRLARAYLASDDAEPARRALALAEKLQQIGGSGAFDELPPSIRAVQQQEAYKLIARALALEARARGNIGETDKAIELALKSYYTFPTGEALREAARWEVKAGRTREAIEHYAEAFSIPDPKVTEENRAHHRGVLRDLYTKINGSETGLGDLILQAYDRTARAVRETEAALKGANPNRGVLDPLEFRLNGLQGGAIRLAGFRGKVQVLDFWATWCAPCRILHPLLDQVRQKYGPAAEVVFHSINTDQDRTKVAPFLAETGWSPEVHFEDGLAEFYRITSIPTTMIFNRRGELVSRFAGFSPATYVQSLTEKIEQARRE